MVYLRPVPSKKYNSSYASQDLLNIQALGVFKEHKCGLFIFKGFIYNYMGQ